MPLKVMLQYDKKSATKAFTLVVDVLILFYWNLKCYFRKISDFNLQSLKEPCRVAAIHLNMVELE